MKCDKVSGLGLITASGAEPQPSPGNLRGGTSLHTGLWVRVVRWVSSADHT